MCACVHMRARACVFRHVLPMSREVPAQLTIDHYFTSADVAGCRRHPRTTFPTALDKDLQEQAYLKPVRSSLAEIA